VLQAANLTAKVGQATLQRDIEQERTKALIADLSKRRVTEQNVQNAIARIRGRAINNSESDWPRTLTGFPLDIYNKWQEAFRVAGYRLTAKILEFPGGMPGDVGLFIGWS